MRSRAQYLPGGALPRSVSVPRKIRVCHIMSADLWAGAEAQVATLASYLAGQPEVDLTAVLLNEGQLARELRRLGLEVRVIEENQNSVPKILAFLTRFLRDTNVEVVHTHQYKDNVLGTIAAKLAGVPHVIRTVHGLREPMSGWDWAKFQAYEALDMAMLRCFADRIIAVSKHMAETLTDAGYRPTTLAWIHNGVDLRTIRATRTADGVRRELGIDSRLLLIGTAGRLSRVKGHAFLLRAARLILQRESGVRFLFVGSGPLADELVASARTLGLERKCLFVGHRDDIYDLIAAMDVFALPSLNEGIPMALLEAMALGRPVVATAVGGVPEIIQHRATGLVVAPGDEEGLADACLELALNPDWAQTLGARARRVVEEKFSHERTGRAVMELYRSVVFRREAGGAGRFDQFPERSVMTSGRKVGGPGPAAAGPDARSGRVDRTTFARWTPSRRLLRRVVAYGERQLRIAVEGRRMRRIRRNPEPVMALLRSAKSVLFVCHGNIIRSAFAEGVVAQALGDGAPVSISSGGLEAIRGTPGHPTAILAAARRSIDLRRHTAAPVTPEAVAHADVIFVMDIPQLVAMRQRFRATRGKTFLLTCLSPEVPLDIRDPVDGDEPVFQACFDHISRALRPVLRILKGEARPAGAADPPLLHAREHPCR